MQAIPVPERDKVQTYWDQTDATVDGMLGGFAGRTDRIETVSSRMFLLQLKPSLSTIVPPHRTDLPPRRLTKALDAGAGIGRVAGSTLLPLLDRVDCVETSAHFLDKAVESSACWPGIEEASKGVRFWHCGMQDFDPLSPPLEHLHGQVGTTNDWDRLYDVIWMQWCVVHLTDEHFRAFLARCKAGLRPDSPDGSYIVIKDNVARDEPVWDELDHSLMRTDAQYKAIFAAAGLTVVAEEVQGNLPRELLPVKTCVERIRSRAVHNRPWTDTPCNDSLRWRLPLMLSYGHGQQYLVDQRPLEELLPRQRPDPLRQRISLLQQQRPRPRTFKNLSKSIRAVSLFSPCPNW
jgi:protein N-terminal methyltransferase